MPAAPSVAICTMIRNERPYLLEWLAFHALHGVSHFRIYDNDSNDGSGPLLLSLRDAFDIELIPWPETGTDRQVLAFDHAVRALAGQMDFVAFIDADEFLFDRTMRPLPAMLAEIADDVSAIGVNQIVFGSSGQRAHHDDLVIRRFVQRAPDGFAEHRWYKSIVRPDRVSGFVTCHNAQLRAGRYVLGDLLPFSPAATHPGEADRIAVQGLALHHYALKSLEEFRRKQTRGAVSDRPEADYKRHDDEFFLRREPLTNLLEDRSLAAGADAVQRRMVQAGPPAYPSPLPPSGLRGFAIPVGCPTRIDDVVPRFGFHDAEAEFAWVRPFSEARLLLALDGSRHQFALRAYCIASDYDVAAILVRLNGQNLPITVAHEDDNWVTLQTGATATQAGNNLLSLELPYFVPVRYVQRGAPDSRYLGIGLSQVTVN